MISDEHVRQLYQNSQKLLAEHGRLNMPVPSPPQFYRGIAGHNWKGQHPGSCKRHKSVFFRFNIIPRYCFSCYKVLVKPRTVVELFKLMVLFKNLDLPNNNTRKCMIEDREQVSGIYKGFIYCAGIDEGHEILTMLRKVIANDISEKIPVSLKRGCSEYSLAYPEYEQSGQGTPSMEYKEEWQVYEDLADKEFSLNAQPPVEDTHNHPGYNLMDARIMHAWLRYAATTGDSSYLKLSGKSVPPISGLERSLTSNPVEEE